MTKAMWAVYSSDALIAAFDREADAWHWLLSPDREWGVTRGVSPSVAVGQFVVKHVRLGEVD